MGLDCFASRSPDDLVLTDEDETAFNESGIELCGGLFSGDGGSSFRGKVYWDLVYAATEISISDNLSPAEVRDLAERLNRYTPDELVAISEGEQCYRSTSRAECEGLQRWFAICAKRGLGLLAWS